MTNHALKLHDPKAKPSDDFCVRFFFGGGANSNGGYTLTQKGLRATILDNLNVITHFWTLETFGWL